MPRRGIERVRLPDERESITHKFTIRHRLQSGKIVEYDGYLIVGLYEDKRPGEMFVHISKTGTLVAGLLDLLAISVSIGLQYGVPLHEYVNKFIHQRFEPEGTTSNQSIPYARSIPDYIFKWLGMKYCDMNFTDTSFETSDQ